MIRSLHEVSKLAKEKDPKKLAVFTPEDGEFTMAVKVRMGKEIHRTCPHRPPRKDEKNRRRSGI